MSREYVVVSGLVMNILGGHVCHASEAVKFRSSRFIFLLSVLFTLAACSSGDSGDSGGDADETRPVITLSGDNLLEVSFGSVYTDPGATATDNVDGNITASIVVGGDAVNTGALGTYTITYDVSDVAGNAAIQVTRTVNVINDEVPVIALAGANTINMVTGSTYTELGATATDNVDGDLTASIVIGGDTVNISIPGSYIVTYDVTDSSGAAFGVGVNVSRTIVRELTHISNTP